MAESVDAQRLTDVLGPSDDGWNVPARSDTRMISDGWEILWTRRKVDLDGTEREPKRGIEVTQTMTEGRGGLVVRLASGAELPLVVGPAQIREITGDQRSEHAIRADCSAGVIPTLQRPRGSGAHHRIPVAKYLDGLGIPYEVVPARAS